MVVVTLIGKDYYLGPYGTHASKVLYDRLIAEYLASNRVDSASNDNSDQIANVEVLDAFWKFCKSYYIKNGTPTNEQDAFRLIIRDIRDLYGDVPAMEFGPKALKAVRQKWIDRGQCRATVNKNMRRLTRIFKWAVSEELIAAPVYQALTTVPGLKKGRCEVRESTPIDPVALAIVEQTIEHLSPTIRDMVRMQLLTGMRPGEICLLRPCDIDRSTDVWEYHPSEHKTEHHSRKRTIYIGPEAQQIISRYLLRQSDSFCFSPEETMQRFQADRNRKRVTPLSCGNRPGTNRKATPKKQPLDCYTPDSYRRAIHRACDQTFIAPAPFAKLPKETSAQRKLRLTEAQYDQLRKWCSDHRWSPNQLRHTAATKIRREFGLEAAHVILGHAAADFTQVYAERDAEKARDVARRIG